MSVRIRQWGSDPHPVKILGSNSKRFRFYGCLKFQFWAVSTNKKSQIWLNRVFDLKLCLNDNRNNILNLIIWKYVQLSTEKRKNNIQVTCCLKNMPQNQVFEPRNKVWAIFYGKNFQMEKIIAGKLFFFHIFSEYCWKTKNGNHQPLWFFQMAARSCNFGVFNRKSCILAAI